MLIAKLDYLQYIVVRGFVSNIGVRSKALWRSIRSANQAKQEAKDSSTAGELWVCRLYWIIIFNSIVAPHSHCCSSHCRRSGQYCAVSRTAEL